MELQKTLTIEVEGRQFTVNFPTNRQYIAIQNLRVQMASQYDQLQYMGAESSYAQVLTDAIAHLRVLCPELTRALKKDILDLELKEGMVWVDVYTKQLRPWYSKVLDFVFKASRPEEEDVKDDNTESEEQTS